jgi:hypothetical protein
MSMSAGPTHSTNSFFGSQISPQTHYFQFVYGDSFRTDPFDQFSKAPPNSALNRVRGVRLRPFQSSGSIRPILRPANSLRPNPLSYWDVSPGRPPVTWRRVFPGRRHGECAQLGPGRIRGFCAEWATGRIKGNSPWPFFRPL